MVWRGKTLGSTKLRFTSLQLLVKFILVAFYRSATNSEHGDTKLVVLLELTESIAAKTFLEIN